MSERYGVPNKTKMRNLRQYKNMTDEEFEDFWSKKVFDAEPSRILEERTDAKLKEFEEDYDLSDLKINDRAVLRNLAQAIITLEDYEQSTAKIRAEGLNESNIALMRDAGQMMTALRKDISNMQTDLNISRKARKGDKDQSVIAAIDDLKQKAKTFYQSKMNYIWCPKCKMLLGTIWVQYPEEKGNKVTLVCDRTMPDGSKCGEKVHVVVKDLIDNRGINIEGIPEFFK